MYSVYLTSFERTTAVGVGLFGGSEHALEGDHISLLESNGQALQQEYCLSGIVSNLCD